MPYGLVSVQRWLLNTDTSSSVLIQVKITKKDKHGTATEWPRPLNRGGRLIEVTNTAFVWAKNRDFENWPLNRGWRPNTGPLYTYSTVWPSVLLRNVQNIRICIEEKQLFLLDPSGLFAGDHKLGKLYIKRENRLKYNPWNGRKSVHEPHRSDATHILCKVSFFCWNHFIS